MKKIAQKNLPSNLKPSSQNIDEIGRSSQGAPQKFTARERAYLKKRQTSKARENKYTLKEAMSRLK